MFGTDVTLSFGRFLDRWRGDGHWWKPTLEPQPGECHTCAPVHIYIHTHAWKPTFVFVYVCVCVCVLACTHSFVCENIHTFYTRARYYMRVCMCICVCVHTCLHTFFCVWEYPYILHTCKMLYACVYVYICTHVCVHLLAHILLCVRISIHFTHMQDIICVYVCVFVCILEPGCRCMYVPVYVCKHPCMCSGPHFRQMYACVWLCLSFRSCMHVWMYVLRSHTGVPRFGHGQKPAGVNRLLVYAEQYMFNVNKHTCIHKYTHIQSCMPLYDTQVWARRGSFHHFASAKEGGEGMSKLNTHMHACIHKYTHIYMP